MLNTTSNIEDILTILQEALKSTFVDEVSHVYFGDISNYLPSAFIGENKRQSAVIALAPDYDHPYGNERVAAHETRELAINIMVLANISNEFVANPQEAFGERRLLRLVNNIRTYLTQQANEDLANLVMYTEIGDIDWTYRIREEQAIRIAVISYIVRIRIRRDQI